MEIELSVQVDPQFRASVDRERVSRVVQETLRQERIAKPLGVGLLVTDDENIKRLNLRYRGQDQETDVLAFPMQDNDSGFVSPASLAPHLGEVVISYPRVEAQAKEYCQSVAEELDRLVVHGVLHLLGYDDQTVEDRERMWQRQEAILREFEESTS